MRRVLAGVLIATVIGGCSRTEPRDEALDYGSVADVRALLASAGAQVPLACTNVRYPSGEVIRSIACAATLPDDALQRLVATYKMKPGPAFHGDMRDGCESRPGLRSGDPGVTVYVGANERVPNGIGRIEIHVDRARRTACVEVTYPWSE